MLSEAERRLRARIGAYSLHAKHDTRVVSLPGRTAAFRKFLDEVDPDGVLPEVERLRRAKAAQNAHLAQIALKSVQSRRKARAS